MKQDQLSMAVVDVRTIAPRERHPLIFQTFDRLDAGEAFLLLNDHEPKPLYYQFLHERENQFTWDYLEAGPDIWKVIYGKCKLGSAPHRREKGSVEHS